MILSRGKLTTHAIAKTYHGRVVVQDVSLEVGAGEIVGLLGPNGAGKTTTFYIIVGLIRPQAGTVCLDGTVLTPLSMHKRARLGIAYLPQEPSIFRRMTVEENILAILETLPGRRSERNEKLEKLLEQFGIEGIRKAYGYSLSGGERRRVELARLLATSPRFILLDEPFTGIDPIMVKEIQNFIFFLKEQDVGVLVTDHRVHETLEITDRAYIMCGGRILQSGSPQVLVENPQVKQIYLGEHFSFYGR
jgi:lipopolysaccharide export system ATP-binding protein